MRFCLICLLILVCFTSIAVTQDGMVVEQFDITTELGIFETEVQVVTGVFQNTDDVAYEAIEVLVEAVDAEGNVIGEGFGFPADACGNALIDRVVFPGARQAFRAELEIFVVNTQISDLQFVIEADASEQSPQKALNLQTNVEKITSDEVVKVEWLDEQNLRYGVGCYSDLFTEWDWYALDVANNIIRSEPHPDAALVTPTMLELAGLTFLSQGGVPDPFVAGRSWVTYPPGERRIVYQNDLHTLFTAERDGGFRRIVVDGLHSYSLQGFQFAPQTFLAYYFGAYGEPVRYVMGDLAARFLSQEIDRSMPSVTVPSLTPDAQNIVIGARVDGVSGYYLKPPLFDTLTLIHATELPGNNYPAPIYLQHNGATLLYSLVPTESQLLVQCFYAETQSVTQITELPFTIADNQHAWSWMSPNNTTLAIGVDGADGGLWLIDLENSPSCVS